MANPGLLTGVLESITENSWGGFDVSVQVESSDNKGRTCTGFVDARIDKFQAEKGLVNAYRPYIGKTVFAPALYGIYQKDKGAKPYEQVEITGLPLKLQAVQPVSQNAPLKTA